MDLDLELDALGLNVDIDHLKLLRTQLNSVQAIRHEQQRKDDVIHKLKQRVRILEQERRSYEDIKEHVLMQTQHVSLLRDKEMQGKIVVLNEQLVELKGQVNNYEEELENNKARLRDAAGAINKCQNKIEKLKEKLEEERNKSSQLQSSLDSQRRQALEKEAELSLEINNADQQIQKLQRQVHDSECRIAEQAEEYSISKCQLNEHFSHELRVTKDEVQKWKSMYNDLETTSKSWKQFSESVLSHEKLSTSQYQNNCELLREELKKCNEVYSSDIMERNTVIEELRQIVQSTTEELHSSRQLHSKEIESILKEKEVQNNADIGDLQKEIGALQVGLCLQKEMKDTLQNNFNHLKSCLRSLAVDLSKAFETNEEQAVRSYHKQLCDLFDRLLVSGALVSDNPEESEIKSSRNWDEYVGHMHHYLNQHHNLVSKTSTPGGSVSKYGKSLNIDSDFLSVIKSLKDLLRRALNVEGVPSTAVKREITKLVEHMQLLKSDLDQSDLLIHSVVNQLSDEGFVDATALHEFHLPNGLIQNFGMNTGELLENGMHYQSGSKQRAVLHAKLCTGVSEAIRVGKLALDDLKKERYSTEALGHQVEMLKMKLNFETNNGKITDSGRSPSSDKQRYCTTSSSYDKRESY